VKRTHMVTVMTAALGGDGVLPTQHEVGAVGSDALAAAKRDAEAKRGCAQTILGAGATTVQTQEGQCLLLFVSLCDAVKESEA
jgi:hypothetical protein